MAAAISTRCGHNGILLPNGFRPSAALEALEILAPFNREPRELMTRRSAGWYPAFPIANLPAWRLDFRAIGTDEKSVQVGPCGRSAILPAWRCAPPKGMKTCTGRLPIGRRMPSGPTSARGFDRAPQVLSTAR